MIDNNGKAMKILEPEMQQVAPTAVPRPNYYSESPIQSPSVESRKYSVEIS